MKSKIVYVSENPEHILQHSVLDIASPKQLEVLLSEGWFITETTKMKVNHPELGKRVAVNRIQLSQESGVTVSGGYNEEKNPSRVLAELVKGNDGLSAAVALIAKSLERQQGPAGENASGYLGRSIAGQIPGVGVVTPLAMQAAYGTGADAAKQGVGIDTCPFPEGSYPYSQWVDGFLNGNGKPDPEMMVAMEEGRAAAKGKDNDVVTCRWKPNTRGYIAWLFAFKKAGGRVEAEG